MIRITPQIWILRLSHCHISVTNGCLYGNVRIPSLKW
jgi:hypothetical protein